MSHTQIVLDRMFDFDSLLEKHTAGITGVLDKGVDEDADEPWSGDDSDDE